jgi:phosphatidylglycerol---prolipoprotein diacylglyceryl transferase
MGLLAQRIAGEQQLSRGAGRFDQAALETLDRRECEGVFVGVGQALPFGGEAFMSEPFGEIAQVQRDGRLRIGRLGADCGHEGLDVEIDLRVVADAEDVRLDLEELARIDARLRQRALDDPQGLAQAGARRPVGVGPELGRECLAGASLAIQDEQRKQRLAMAPAQPQLARADGRLHSAEEPNRQPCCGCWDCAHGSDSVTGASVRTLSLRPHSLAETPQAWKRPLAVPGPSPLAAPPKGSQRRKAILLIESGAAERRPDTETVAQPTPAKLGSDRSFALARLVAFDTLRAVPAAVIAFDFDPLVRFGDTTVKLETFGIALAVLVGLLLAGWVATRTSAPVAAPGPVPPSGAMPADPHDANLRIYDMIFIVLAILPGAVIGGRLGYVLIHFDFYRSNLAAIVDPSQGSLELMFGVVGGALTGVYACYLLGESPGRWLHVATVPTFAAIALGKVAQAFGGAGQGQPVDLPWATSYGGDGSWGSLAPSLPSHPAQLYEAAVTFLILLLMARLLGGGLFDRLDGRSFLFAFAIWALGRAAVAFTWRDARALGSLNAEQGLCLLAAALSFLLILALTARARRLARTEAKPGWPDPEVRPQF